MRIDQLLVSRGLARSRAVASELLRDGRVRLGEQVVRKPSTAVTEADRVEVTGEVERWVGRAAYKLLAALEEFPVEVAGRRCIDVGASTGGFTQVLLDAGAGEVVALDVGRDQLAEVVRADPRVIERSGQTVRGIDPGTLGGPAAIVVTDLSFISLRLVLTDLARLTAADGDLVALVKPQFEVGRERLGRSGVVTSVEQRAEVVQQVVGDAQRVGLTVHGLAVSPVAGGTGNAEYLMWAAHRSPGKMSAMAIEQFVQRVRRGGA